MYTQNRITYAAGSNEETRKSMRRSTDAINAPPKMIEERGVVTSAIKKPSMRNAQARIQNPGILEIIALCNLHVENLYCYFSVRHYKSFVLSIFRVLP